ncbi:hypothetical protein [Sphingobium limneticum]|uniref:Uncharacterized protein n=1 Tax=Sphingobium limneticum TaxID=1007511 RepID=A0A5J5HNE8_9SPHN|nr:hypothetical protein [Sphingobium limneticum]KAA9010931.1 hypothetical protein F4U96_24025 [Sphingobium limneticum]KAA9023018.1 hypothetical protein F4U95_23950 [Sphingobium limneticum]
MTQYANPNLTQREIVEQSKAAVEQLLANVDETVTAGRAELETALDQTTVQIIGQHLSMLNGSKFQLEAERTRLQNIIAVWNGEEPTAGNTFTPTLPITPAA